MKGRQAFRSAALLFGVAMTASIGLAKGVGGQVQSDNPSVMLARGSLEIWVPKTFFTGQALSSVMNQQASPFYRLVAGETLEGVKPLVPPERGEPLVKVEIPFGVGWQPHRWRIWAISRTGAVSISEWRTIDFTN